MKKILIANRGEIAVRVIRACKELGYKTVAVFSTADRESLHAKMADESVCIGPGPAAQSYLSIPAIMSAVEIVGADAVHPGYGFLSENKEFAKVCEQYGIIFIGPTSQQIELLGDKISARRVAAENGVPLLPGCREELKTYEQAKAFAAEAGLPLIIKASAGGGGRGMKIVRSLDDLKLQFEMARSEAEKAFGNPAVYMEKYIERPRHVEVQLLCDKHGTFLHLGERDCSIQRRHQKIIEEAPSPVVDETLRAKIGAAAVTLAKAVGYSSVGTVEFLMDDDGSFYFMEVNTRIQVEHPVTEIVTGIDLIKYQIRVAFGEKLDLRQEDVKITGHAIECRVNAEDPKTFAPWPGRITDVHQPGGPGIRIDSMIYAGYSVPALYDSMIAKVIAFGKDREEARVRMARALAEFQVDGIRTNLELHEHIISDSVFTSGELSTRYLEEFFTRTSYNTRKEVL